MNPETEQAGKVERTYSRAIKFGVPIMLVLVLVLLLIAALRFIQIDGDQNQTTTAIAVLSSTPAASPTPDATDPPTPTPTTTGPVIMEVSEDPQAYFAAEPTGCEPNRALIQTQVTDMVPVESVAVILIDGITLPMTQTDSETWEVMVGPSREAGSITYYIKATNNQGQTTSSTFRSVAVQPCNIAPSTTPTTAATHTPTATMTLTNTKTPSATHTATSTPTATHTTTFTATPSATSAPTESATPTATFTPAASPTPEAAAAIPTEQPLEAPTITAPLSGATIPPGPVLVEGTAAPDTQVQVRSALAVIGITIAGPDGTWRARVELIQPGEIELIATVIDPAQGRMLSSEPVTITVQQPSATPTQTSPPSTSTSTSTGTPTRTPRPSATPTQTSPPPTPTSTSTGTPTRTPRPSATPTQTPQTAAVVPTNIPKPAITEPVDGATVDTTQLIFAGTAGPGALVAIVENGVELARDVAGEDGSWQLNVNLTTDAEPQRERQFRAIVLEEDGSVLAESEPVTLMLAWVQPSPTPTTPPTATPEPVVPVMITAPGNDAPLAPGNNTFGGTAEPGSTVALVDKDGNVLGTTTAKQTGTWVIVVELVDTGDITLTAQVLDAGGTVQTTSEPVVYTVVPAIAPNTGGETPAPGEIVRSVGFLVVLLLAALGAAFILIGYTLRQSVRDGLAAVLKFRPPRSKK